MADLRRQIESLSPPRNSNCLEADAEAQRAELDHRIAQYEQNPSDVIQWEQVRADLFRKS